MTARIFPSTRMARTRIRVLRLPPTTGNNTQTYTVVIRRLGGGGPTDTTLATLSLSDVETFHDGRSDPSV